MAKMIRAPKDFWTGISYIALGGAALWFGQVYRIGSAGRMGPGYFPQALGAILVLIGFISLARSFLVKGDAITGIVWKPMALILLAIALFGVLLPRGGLVIALLALCVVSAAASKEFRVDWRTAGGLAVFIAFCVLLFVKGLGVPMPIVGTWLQPYFTAPWLR